MSKNGGNMKRKSLAIITILLLLFQMIAIFLFQNVVSADSNRYDYNGSNINTGVYPGYKEKIDAVRAQHPNWKFVIMETGLDWEQVITAEKGDKSLIQSKSGNWVSGQYDNAWDKASENAIRYYMDPRNWISADSSIFQFMQLSYQDISDENLYNALNSTFLYTMEYAKAINSACREQNVNPIYVVARIMQEQGNPSTSATFKMQDSDGQIYYNLFNIGATGAGTSQIVSNALTYARNHGWTSISICLRDGITFLSDYLNAKQDTLYLNKYDVETYNGTYWKQYMQNIEAPKTEAAKMYSMLEKANLLNSSMTFIIPVYSNMPNGASLSPERLGEIGPVNIKVKNGHNNIAVRTSPDKNGTTILRIDDKTPVMLSVQRINGWHKIIFKQNNEFKTGYVLFNSSYLEQINDVANCSETMTIIPNGTALYSGPGDIEIKRLVNGQIVTRIDNSGTYTLNGIVWDRVLLSDGAQGFVDRNSLIEEKKSDVYTTTTDLNMRDAPAGSAIRVISTGTKVTRIETAASTVNMGGTPYYWDKVTTPSGAIGYVARDYLKGLDGNMATAASSVIKEKLININVDFKNKLVTVEPDTTYETFIEKLGNKATVKKADNKTVVTEGLMGTGYIVIINGEKFTAIKIGDGNGDGKINSGDLFATQKYLLGKSKDLDKVYIKAIDANKDSKNNSGDLFIIQKYLLGKTNLVL